MIQNLTNATSTQNGFNFWLSNLQKMESLFIEPLTNFTWRRDLFLEEDLAPYTSSVSFTVKHFTADNNGASSFPYITPEGTTSGLIDSTISTPIYKVYQLGYTIRFNYAEISLMDNARESQTIAQASRVISERFNDVRTAYESHMDKAMYLGDEVNGYFGLANQPMEIVQAQNVAAGASGGSLLWADKTADEIVKDIVEPAESIIVDNGLDPNIKLIYLLPLDSLVYLRAIVNSQAGVQSLYEYITARTGYNVEILGCKWLKSAGAGDTRRMVVFAQNDPRDIGVSVLLPQRQNPVQNEFSYTVPFVASFTPPKIARSYLLRYRDGF